MKPYFPPQKNAPPPLRIEIKRQVRFEEVDAMGVVWHGRYPSYIEDARQALGEKYGVGYLDLYRQGILTPIKKLHVDYHLPLVFHEEFTIEGILHWTEAARIDFEFAIRNHNGETATTGYTVQVMLDQAWNILLLTPPAYEEFRRRWKAGELK